LGVFSAHGWWQSQDIGSLIPSSIIKQHWFEQSAIIRIEPKKMDL
jgi:hypothetical protein